MLAVHIELVVVKTVDVVPQPKPSQCVHSAGDRHEVLEEIRRHVFICRIFASQFQRHREHRQAIGRHPGGAVGLFQFRSPGSGSDRSNTPMLSSPRNPPEKMLPSTSLRFTHQVKFISSFWNTRARKTRSRLPARTGHLVDAPACPGMHRRIDVRKVELVGRDLPIGVHVPLAQQQQQLLFGEVRIEPGEAEPCEKPDPRPRTRDTPTCPASESRRGCRDAPVVIAPHAAIRRRRRLARVAVQPIAR